MIVFLVPQFTQNASEVKLGLPNLEKASTVLIFLPVGTFDFALDPKEVSEIIHEPRFTSGLPGLPTMIESLRDQISTQLGGERVAFRDYSEDQPGKEKFPTIVRAILRIFERNKVTFRGYGWNYDVTFSSPQQQKPGQEIVHRYLNAQSLESTGSFKLVGAGLNLYFLKDGNRHRFRLEPQGNTPEAEKYYAHINVHRDLKQGVVPEPTVLQEEFNRYYHDFINLLESLVR